jgi:hypothetical protein
MFYLRLIVVSLVAHASMTMFAFCNDFHEPESQVWKVGQHRWTIQEEYNYSKWIETNITEDFFIRHEIRVDCADVPYALRWIYARINHLPAAAKTVNNRLIGHWSTDWKHIPTDENWAKDRRFRAALLYMIYRTSTRTLPSDTYPIHISADSMTAGTTFLIAGDHAVIVSHIVMDGSTPHPVQTFEANLPTRYQRLLLRNFAFLDPCRDRVSGFLKFCWPIKTASGWRYLPVKEHPFYSDEQYSAAFTKGYADYFEAIEKRIVPKVYDPNEKTEKIINTLTNRLNERIPIVLEGNNKCHIIQCPDGSLMKELYSTPDRDEFINVMLGHLEEIIRKNNLNRNAILNKMEQIRLRISPDRFVTLQQVFKNSKWMSSDPEATIEARWGLDKCRMIAKHLKNAQESISFIQKNYSKTDPHFAERSIGIQQRTVDEMTKESQENNCTIDPNQS